MFNPSIVSVTLLQPAKKSVRVRFEEEYAARGFGVLRRAGVIELYANEVYGVTSQRQLKALEERDIPYEIVE